MSLAVPGIKDDTWRTPAALRLSLEQEFGALWDPCPGDTIDGLSTPWQKRVFLNPPYGRGKIAAWLVKAIHEASNGALVVALLPSYTGSPWWHDLVIPHATEIRFLRGKLRFGDGRGVAPFWSAIVIFGTKP